MRIYQKTTLWFSTAVRNHYLYFQAYGCFPTICLVCFYSGYALLYFWFFIPGETKVRNPSMRVSTLFPSTQVPWDMIDAEYGNEKSTIFNKREYRIIKCVQNRIESSRVRVWLDSSRFDVVMLRTFFPSSLGVIIELIIGKMIISFSLSFSLPLDHAPMPRGTAHWLSQKIFLGVRVQIPVTYMSTWHHPRWSVLK